MQDLSSLYDFVELEVPLNASGDRAKQLLRTRRIKRVLQAIVRRVIDPAFESLDVTYPGWGRPIPGTVQINWIPDFQHLHLPELFDRKEIRARSRASKRIASRRGMLVLSSEASFRDFTAEYPNREVNTRIWRFCSSLTEDEANGEDPRSSLGLPDHYLYVANQFWAHKEHLTLFKALTELKRQGVQPSVVCTGLLQDRRNPGYAPQITRFIDEHQLDSQVTLLGMLERSTQIQVLRRSAAVIQPSRFEGWSTVVEDAKAFGRPVILSDIDVHKEQLPGGHFFEVGSATSLARVIGDVVDSLSPGPDMEAEAKARRNLDRRRVELGRQFLDICKEAVRLQTQR